MLKKLLIISVSVFFSLTILAIEPEISFGDSWNLDAPSVFEVLMARQKIVEKFGSADLEKQITSRQVPNEYNHIDPKGIVPDLLLKNALLFFDQYKSSFANQRYISIVDFSMHSSKARMFIINMKSGMVSAVRTAHGAGGDLNDNGYVEQLSNIINSHMSSRGYYQVSEIYYGNFGRSIRLDGLSKTNSNVRPRAIVIHGDDNVTETGKQPGRSWGCFSLAWSVKDQVVTRIHGGSLLYADKL